MAIHSLTAIDAAIDTMDKSLAHTNPNDHAAAPALGGARFYDGGGDCTSTRCDGPERNGHRALTYPAGIGSYAPSCRTRARTKHSRAVSMRM